MDFGFADKLVEIAAKEAENNQALPKKILPPLFYKLSSIKQSAVWLKAGQSAVMLP